MSGLVTALLSFAVAFCMTLFALPRFAHIATKLGLVDLPGRRKIHQTPRPLVGGLAMSLGVSFACLLFVSLNYLGGYHGGSMRGYYAGSILLVVMGFFDDFREVHHRLKFAAQVIAALLVVFLSRVSLTSFGDLLHLGPIVFPHHSIPMTVIGMVGVINAINMIDGVDGLAGGVSLVVFGTFAALASLDSHRESMLVCLALCGALMAFLKYNWPPSSLFMGDAGSLFLGFSAAFFSIVLTQDEGSRVRPIAPLLVLAVPITDTLTVMIKRVIGGKSPFHADKTHLHHILLKFGFSKQQTTSIIVAMTAVFSLLALSGTIFRVPDYFLFGIFLVYFFAYFAFSFMVKKILIRRKAQQRIRTPSMP
jgi:UDP-GlcNAc:undecaprenyl-phosphate GlcNAc-1-phosphate transferase